MVLKNHSSYVGICSDWLYARTLRAVLCGRWLCGHCYLAQRRRGAEFFGDGFGSAALGRDDLRVVRYRYRIRFCCIWEGRPPCRPLPPRHSLTGLTAHRTLDFHVISKLLAVDTEVDPPQQNSRHIRHRVVFPR